MRHALPWRPPNVKVEAAADWSFNRALSYGLVARPQARALFRPRPNSVFGEAELLAAPV